jgi:hypothetical protein
MEKCAVKLVVFNGEDFGYEKKLNLQLSLEPGSRHLRDRPEGIRDPRYTRPRDPRYLISLLLL